MDAWVVAVAAVLVLVALRVFAATDRAAGDAGDRFGASRPAQAADGAGGRERGEGGSIR